MTEQTTTKKEIGSYIVLQLDGAWQVAQVLGYHESLARIESRVHAASRRSARPARPTTGHVSASGVEMGPRPAASNERATSEARWAEQRARAGQPILRLVSLFTSEAEARQEAEDLNASRVAARQEAENEIVVEESRNLHLVGRIADQRTWDALARAGMVLTSTYAGVYVGGQFDRVELLDSGNGVHTFYHKDGDLFYWDPKTDRFALSDEEFYESFKERFPAMKRAVLAEAEYEIQARETIKSLDILQGSFGCASCNHAEVDPYWFAADWHEAARGDGHSYSGTLETVSREEGESFEDFMARAEQRAWELNQELACPFH